MVNIFACKYKMRQDMVKYKTNTKNEIIPRSRRTSSSQTKNIKRAVKDRVQVRQDVFVHGASDFDLHLVRSDWNDGMFFALGARNAQRFDEERVAGFDAADKRALLAQAFRAKLSVAHADPVAGTHDVGD